MQHEELLAICTQVAQYVIIDQALRYVFVLPLLFTLILFLYIVKKHQNRMRHYVLNSQSRFPKKLQTILSTHHLQPSHFIVVQSKRFIAETVGVASSKIILSTGLIQSLSLNQLEAIVLHESFHRSHFHPILKLLSNTFQNIFFFFPIIGDVMQYLHLIMETTADDYAITVQQSTRHLQSALIAFLKYETQPSIIVSAFAQDGHRERIAHLTCHQYPRFLLRKKTLFSTLASLIFLFSLWSAQVTLAHTVDRSQVGKELRSSCTFFQCIANCQQTVKSYSENIPVSKHSSY